MDHALLDRIVSWRHHLHAHPELSRQERATAAFVCERLRELNIPFEAGIGGHGVVATLQRGASNRSVGLRGDMDALPIAEATGVSYASTAPKVMHACGHDGHTASLLGAAAMLAGDPDWHGTVRFVFQPAEEGFGGAQAMLDDGLLQRFPVERIFGYHNWPGLPVGTIALHDGPVMSAATRVEITLHGTAGHGAMPQHARDPILGAAHLLVALQAVVSRAIDPVETAVLSLCTIRGGEAANQIPDRVTITGTSRAYTTAVQDRMDAEIRRIGDGVAAAFGLRAEITLHRGTPATVNSPAETTLAERAAAGLGAPVRRDVPPSMVSEDFGCYQQHIPGCFAWIGVGETHPGLHTPDYDFNDAILPVAAGWLAGAAKQALAES